MKQLLRNANKIRGVIFGQAAGDALGLGAEGLSKSQVSESQNGISPKRTLKKIYI